MISRRDMLRGACVSGVGIAGLTGCGVSDRASGGDRIGPVAPGTSLGSTADVPVGGGKVYISPAVVVTQPTAGAFRAFSSRCTHAGCPVTEIDDGVISCPCHGSEFSIGDGSVTRPPASEPLAPIAITISGGTITVA
jgi:Rieske Fe-S protein